MTATTKKIFDYLNFDTSLLTHLETTYYHKKAILDQKQQELHEILEKINTVPLSLKPGDTAQTAESETDIIHSSISFTIDDYNKWRNERLKVASVSEKLKWNQIRRDILQKSQGKSIQPKEDISSREKESEQISSLTTLKVVEIKSLFEFLQKEQKALEEIWTEIVNYRAMINLTNCLKVL